MPFAINIPSSRRHGQHLSKSHVNPHEVAKLSVQRWEKWEKQRTARENIDV